MKSTAKSWAIAALCAAGACGAWAQQGKVAYLGVATEPVDAALARQLDLPEGVGLAVRYVDGNSPAAGKIEVGDVVEKFCNETLTDHRQLAVLVRRQKPGDEVTLALLRKAKRETVKLQLGETDWAPLPPAGGAMAPGPGGFGPGPGLPPDFPVFGPPPGRPELDVEKARARIREMLEEMGFGDMSFKELFRALEEQPGAPRPRGWRRGGDPAVHVESRSTSVRTEVRDGIALTLTVEDGHRTLKIVNDDGKVLFEGPVNTPAEREAIPRDLRERFEQFDRSGSTRVNILPAPAPSAPAAPPAAPPPNAL